jgi:hypothetical protein
MVGVQSNTNITVTLGIWGQRNGQTYSCLNNYVVAGAELGETVSGAAAMGGGGGQSQRGGKINILIDKIWFSALLSS